MTNLKDLSCQSFSEKIASKEPVPGGGGVSAMVGSFAIALGDMVGNFTLGKKKFIPVEEEIKALMEESDCLRKELLDLVDEDAKLFEPLSKAYAIPKDDPNREEVLEKCLQDAVCGPLKMVRAIAKSIEVLAKFSDGKASAIIISDVATAAALSMGALLGAAINVKVNTKSFSDRKLADEINAEVDGLVKEYSAKAKEIYEEINKRYI